MQEKVPIYTKIKDAELSENRGAYSVTGRRSPGDYKWVRLMADIDSGNSGSKTTPCMGETNLILTVPTLSAIAARAPNGFFSPVVGPDQIDQWRGRPTI